MKTLINSVKVLLKVSKNKKETGLRFVLFFRPASPLSTALHITDK